MAIIVVTLQQICSLSIVLVLGLAIFFYMNSKQYRRTNRTWGRAEGLEWVVLHRFILTDIQA